jgi:hypothetical protein
MRHSQQPSFIEKTKSGVKTGFIKKDIYTKINNINLVLDTLSPDQASYYAIFNSSKFLNFHGFTGISLYVDEINNPVFYPMTAIFSSNDLQNIEEPVVVTSLKTLELAVSYDVKEIYYYVYNIHELINSNKEKTEILKRPNIKYFTRNKDYYDVLEKHFHLKVSKVFVPDFNMNQMEKALSE